MQLDIRHASHPQDVKHYTTADLRRHFLIDPVFTADAVNLTYSHIDRIIVGGIMPVHTTLALAAGKELGVETFFERREGGVINIGGAGTITVDGTAYPLGFQDALYIGKGAQSVTFAAQDPAAAPKFYFNSAPAHAAYPTTLISLATAKKVHLGSPETSNQRTINQYIHPDVVASCQLVMGMTILAAGSVWNTMPAHTHERRMEIYTYFELAPEHIVFHMMGEPHETRHLVVRNEQAVISPSWSVHAGCGTSNYSFIWAMGGENQAFTDMDAVPADALR